MEKICRLEEDYLYIPVHAGKEERELEIFLVTEDGALEKVFEFMVPADCEDAGKRAADFYAEIPVRQYRGRKFLFRGAFSQAFAEGISVERKRRGNSQERPAVHFTADSGWINDPNGLIYADGVYHLYFQYNPFNISWNNMSWGHAVSGDLIHWRQEDTVLFPDQSGTVFSGCAIANDRGLLGLPQRALLFFYTAAGGSNQWSRGAEFTQKIAYSLDGGRTLSRREQPCLPTVCRENRDPKVYWHEESQAYVMVLWLEENDFGIFRSQDLEHWEQSDRLTLEGAWECPDLLCLSGENGECRWFFWAADGYYFPGDFDGYHFRPYGSRRQAYINNIPYAAQTYFGVEGRVISIPWLRMENDGRTFTGALGFPVELSFIKTAEGYALVQRPARELIEQRRRLEEGEVTHEEDKIVYRPQEGKALVLEIRVGDASVKDHIWEINGSRVCYDSEAGQFMLDGETYRAGCGYSEIMFIIDDRILEVFFDRGIRRGVFPLRERKVRLELPKMYEAVLNVYEV